MKRILFIYPHNFLERNMGTNMRVYSLAKELKAKGYTIDLYAFRNFVSLFDDFDKINEDEKLVDRLYLYDYKEIISSRNKRYICKYISKILCNEELEDWTTPKMVKQFHQILSTTAYDCIVMFYAYTAELVSSSNYKGNALKLYFMEDLLSVSHFISGRSKCIGRLLDSEIKRISYFDKVICISSDEKIFVEKLLPNLSFYFLPHLTNKRNIENKVINKIKRVLFIGYDNEYNIKGLYWFFKNVYVHLCTDIEIVVVGKVSNYIEDDYSNLIKIEYVENLHDLYMGVDIVICPLQNGTGMKIKVVEAMSYGIPVVCTSRGVDGLSDKSKNGCLVEDEPIKFAQAINQLSTNIEYYKECQKNISIYFSEMMDWSVYEDQIAQLFE